MPVWRAVTIAVCLGLTLTRAAAHDSVTGEEAWLTEAVSFRSADDVPLSGSLFPKEGHNLADSPKQASFMAMVDWIR